MAAIALTACDGSVYYDESRSVDEHGWLPQDTLTFDVEVDDTVHLFNFLVEVRNSVEFPDGSVAHDTMECPLADPEGKWLGKRTGRYVDARYRLRGGSARFPMTGHYRFAVTNAMRDSAISGIKDIGLRVEYSGK